MTVEYGKSETDITGICIAGTWSFHIAAINEYGNTGDFSEPRLFNIETNCPSKFVNESFMDLLKYY